MTSHDKLILNIWKDVKSFVKRKDSDLDDLAYQLLVRFDEENIVIEDMIDKLKHKDANLDSGLKELVGDFALQDEDEDDDYDEDFSQYIQSNGEYDHDDED